MKYQVEVEDIKAGFRFGIKGVKESWMVGFDCREKSENQYCVISLLDGMIQKSGMTKHEICHEINKQNNWFPM